MASIYFVRHGEAAAGFDAHVDPPLSERGVAQAKATANHLVSLQPMKIYSSPLRRARETAEELAKIWHQEVTIEDRVAEVPSDDADLSNRAAWLAEIMQGTWIALPKNLRQWRRNMIEFVENCSSDCVIFSHFVAINILVGYAEDSELMVSFRPDNASITRFDNAGDELRVVYKGVEATTRVN